MKKIFIYLISLITVFSGFLSSAFAEANKNFYISDVKHLRGDNYIIMTDACVYGFEETGDVSLRMGELRNADEALKSRISEYISSDEKVFFIEFTAYNNLSENKISLTDKVDMQIKLSRSNLGSGLLGCMGNDYKVLKVSDTVSELPIIESSLYDVTFETDELGIYAVIYNPYAISLSFMSGNETKHYQIDNLCASSVVVLPEPPQKEGYRFAGWYQRENGEGLRLYPEITLGEIADGVVYAHWIEDNTEYLASDTKLKSIVFENNIMCNLKENQYIYFLPEAKDLTEIIATVEPQNPYSYIYFGYSLDNIGELNLYPQNKDDMSFNITKDVNTSESRMYVKVVSEDMVNTAIYSFIFSEETQVIKTNPIEDSAHSEVLYADISGAGSFVLSDIYSSAELRMGELINPDNTTRELLNGLMSGNDTATFFDLLAYDGNVVISESAVANLKVKLYRPSLSQRGEIYSIYRIENGKLIVQNILSSSSDNVIFEADKPGRFAVIYKANPKSNSSGGGRKTRYSVTFDTNGGSIIPNQTINKNSAIKMPKHPHKEEYTFAGWFTDKELTKEFDFNTEITNNITLYAKWDIADITKKQIIFKVGESEASVFGEKKQNDTEPIIKGDRAFLPTRFVAENLGAVVLWDDEARTVTVTKDDVVIVITIDSEKALVNGEEVELDIPSFIENSRTYTPARLVAEALGATVDWNPENKNIVITKSVRG